MKKVTKEDVKNWIKEHKTDIIKVIVTGVTIAAYSEFACKKSYDAGYSKGVDDSDIVEIAIGDLPRAVKNNETPLLFKTKNNRVMCCTYENLDKFVDDINSFVEKYKEEK